MASLKTQSALQLGTGTRWCKYTLRPLEGTVKN